MGIKCISVLFFAGVINTAFAQAGASGTDIKTVDEGSIYQQAQSSYIFVFKKGVGKKTPLEIQDGVNRQQPLE